MGNRIVEDDLGTSIELCEQPGRIVSLVPSLTEAIAVSATEILVGATDWCSQPPELDVQRVRGTKNPNVAQIVALRPDVVVCNKEENRELDVARLRAAGVPVWVTVIETLEQAFDSLQRLFTVALSRPTPAWLDEAGSVWAQPAITPRLRGAVAVWRDPWMVVGRDTFTGDLLAHLGVDNIFAVSPDRYPHVAVDDILAGDPDLVLLPDEPYAFSDSDGPEMFAGRAVALVSGRSLTWYGPSLVAARSELLARFRTTPGSGG